MVRKIADLQKCLLNRSILWQCKIYMTGNSSQNELTDSHDFLVSWFCGEFFWLSSCCCCFVGSSDQYPLLISLWKFLESKREKKQEPLTEVRTFSPGQCEINKYNSLPWTFLSNCWKRCQHPVKRQCHTTSIIATALRAATGTCDPMP